MTGMEAVLESATSDWVIPRSPDDVHKIAEALTLAGFGSQHDAWDAAAVEAGKRWLIGTASVAILKDNNPYPPKVSES